MVVWITGQVNDCWPIGLVTDGGPFSFRHICLLESHLRLVGSRFRPLRFYYSFLFLRGTSDAKNNWPATLTPLHRASGDCFNTQSPLPLAGWSFGFQQ